MVINISLGARGQVARDFSAEALVEAVLPHEAASREASSSSGAGELVDVGDIARRLQAGEARALAQLYDAYGPTVFRLLLAMLGSRVDAEDALQETFVKLAARGARGHLVPRLGALGRVRDWRAYLLVSARNEALSVLRRRDRESQMEQDAAWEQLPDLRPDARLDADPEALRAHDWPRLLGRLPLEQREVVVLKVWEEMTFAQIARVVGVSPNTAMSRFRYAIGRLRAWCLQAEHEEAEHE